MALFAGLPSGRFDGPKRQVSRQEARASTFGADTFFMIVLGNKISGCGLYSGQYGRCFIFDFKQIGSNMLTMVRVVHTRPEFHSERRTEHMKATCTFMLIMAGQKTARKEN